MSNYVIILDKLSFVLKHAIDKEIQQSSKTDHARLRGTIDLSQRSTPSCLSFTYQILGDKSNRLIVSIDNDAIWASRLRDDQT